MFDGYSIVFAVSKDHVINLSYYYQYQKMRLFGLASTNQFADLQQKCKVFSKCSSDQFPNRLISLFAQLFPLQKVSIPKRLYEDSIRDQNNKWVDRLNKFKQILQPNSDFGKALLNFKDISRVDTNLLNLGTEFDPYLSSNSVRQILGIKRGVNSETISVFEAFFMRLCVQLVNLKQYERKKVNWKVLLQTDELHYYLIRNPWICILKQWLNGIRFRGGILNRIVNPMYRFSHNENSLIIKTYHFYGILLILEWRVQIIVQFVNFIVDYLQIRHKNYNNIFSLWIRMHLILKRSEIQKEIMQSINAQNAYHTLYRFKIQQIDNFNSKVKINPQQLQQLSDQIQNLFSKTYWITTPQFLSTIITILFIFREQSIFQRSILSKKIKEILDKIYPTLLKQVSNQQKKEVMHFFQKLGSYIVLQKDDQIQNGTPKSGKNELKYQNREEGGSPASIRKSFRNYQREINPWEYSISKYQSHLLFHLSYQLSKKIDIIFFRSAGQSIHPTTNLRFLASFKNWFIIIILFVILYTY